MDTARLTVCLLGVGCWSNKTKSCCGGKKLGCAGCAGRLVELEGGHVDCWESVVKTKESWE